MSKASQLLTQLFSVLIKNALSLYRGACLTGRWSWDGAGIVTGGEDGAVKIWSR
jgi:intraflagellar transport protein 80